MKNRRSSGLFCLMAALVLWTCGASAAQKVDSDPKHQSPGPDTRAADLAKPVKVYILMGQSNMFGMADVGPADKPGTLQYLVQEKHMYPQLVDEKGQWTQCKDVRYVQVMMRRDKMEVVRNQWLTPDVKTFGPEIGFGYVVGHAHDAPVLILKSCIGNRSLGWDLLPPGSERFEYEGKIYAGYKDTAPSWDKGVQPKPVPWYAGKQYDDDVANAKKVLADLGTYYPGYKGQGYEIAGFVWWQGHKDHGSAALTSRYERNLVALIKSLRNDFNAPNAKFVLATIAFGGEKIAGLGLEVVKAQLAVDGDTGKYPEFKGNVKTIDARPFWREPDVSPVNQDYHYNHNAETYMEVGNALGRAMVELEGDSAKPKAANGTTR